MKSRVELESQRDVVIIRLVGSFHGHEAELSKALGGIQASRVVTDFSRCKHLGSGALAVLMELAKALRLRDGDLKVSGIPASEGPLFRFFDCHETVAQAVAAFT